MRKRVIIGDIHGRYEAVKLIYDKEQPDDVILLGDYVDTHDMISDDKQKDSLENLLTLSLKIMMLCIRICLIDVKLEK